MARPSDDLQRNLVSVVLTIVGLVQGLVLTKIAETMAPFITGQKDASSAVDWLILVLLFAVFLRIFQTFVVGAIGYERSAMEAIELFALTILLFLIGILEYVLINLYDTGKFSALYGVLTVMCTLAAIAYGWLCIRAGAFSQHDPPYATRDRTLQGINTVIAALEGGACAWLAIRPPAPVTQGLIASLIVLLFVNMYISIKFSFYPAEAPRRSLPWRPAAQLLLLYILPPLLIWLGAIDFRWRMHVLIAVGLVIVVLALIDHSITWPALGRRQYAESIVANLAVVIVAGAVGLAYRHWHGPAQAQGVSPNFMVFYTFLSVPLQEFVYRYRLRFLFRNAGATFYVIASAALYAWAHIVYSDLIILIGALLLGVIWGTIFFRTREIFGIVLSHLAIGALAFWIGAA